MEETAFEDVNMWQAPVRRKHPLFEPRMWQGKSGSRDLMGVNAWQGQVWKEAWKPQVGRRELRNTKASPREGEKTAQNSLPPYNMPHSPLGIRRAGAFYYFVFLKRQKCIRGHFFVVFGIRSGPSQEFSRIRRHLRVH